MPPIHSILPSNTEITTVFGSPIEVKQNDSPSAEDINAVFVEVRLNWNSEE